MASSAADQRTVTTKMGTTFVPFPSRAAQPSAPPPLVSYDEYYQEWTRLATTKGGATKAPPRIVANEADSIHKPHLSEKGKEAELRDKILTGTAVGLSAGFGQEMWYPDQDKAGFAAVVVADSPAEHAQGMPVPVTTIPRSALGAHDEEDEDLDAEADALLDFVQDLDDEEVTGDQEPRVNSANALYKLRHSANRKLRVQAHGDGQKTYLDGQEPN